MWRLAVAMWLVTASAAAQSTPAPSTSLVFVYDGGGAHVSGERIRRAIATGLQRPLLRLTDDGASAAVGRLTVAHSPPDRWVVDLVRGEQHTTRAVQLRSSTVSSIARIAIALVTESDPAATVTSARARTPRRSEWISLIGDEILDPFAGQPIVARRHRMGMTDELVDPFAAGAAHMRRTYDDVIDPWSR
jgi:hypothetical protein